MTQFNRGMFQRLLRIATAQFSAPGQRQVSGTRGGEIWTTEVAPSLWQGSFTLPPMTREDAAELTTVLHRVDQPGNYFICFDPAHQWPKSDPNGVLINAASPVITAATTTTLALSGMPANYEISVGDYISFEYGSSPTRVALHRFTEAATASAGGVLSATGVFPAVRGTVTPSTPAVFKEAYCRAVIVPGSVSFGTYSGELLSGVSFAFRQTLGQ